MAIARRTNTPRRVELTGAVGISHAGALHDRLNSLLSRKSKVTLDLRAVERLDTAAAQLLVGFSMAAAHRGVPLHWISPSEEALAALGRVGLLEPCGLDS